MFITFCDGGSPVGREVVEDAGDGESDHSVELGLARLPQPP